MRKRMWIILLVLYAAGVAYVSHQPLSGGSPPFPHFDKLIHILEFGLFMLLAWKATGQRLTAAWILTLVFAGSDELHQSLIPLRDASALDFVADLVGASLMAAVVHYRILLWRFLSTRILGR